MKIYDELVWRGLIKDVSSPDIEEKLNNGGMTFYIGTDPTGDSLHIGHFSSFLISKSLKEAGVDETEFMAKVDMLADRAFEDQCTTANPRVPLVSELKQILIDSYYGN